MRDPDVPAALPLLTFALGLTWPMGASGWLAIAILLLVLRRPRLAMVVLALAGGLFAGAREGAQRARELASLAPLSNGTFAVIEAPVDRDWAVRPGAFLLRVRRFRVNGIEMPASASWWPSRPRRPNAINRPMPATAGGSTRGSSTAVITSERLGKERVASR